MKAAYDKNPSLEDNPVHLASFLQPKDFGTVKFTDAKGNDHPGSWNLTSGAVTLTFPSFAVLTGKIVGNTMSGEATEDTVTWKWEATRTSPNSNEWTGTTTRKDGAKFTLTFSGTGPTDQSLSPPRLGVQVEVLPGDILILRANNQADLDAAIQILNTLKKTAEGSKIEIRMVPIRFGDVMQVTNQLNQLFGRVAFSPNATVLIGSGVTAVVPGQAPQGLLPGGATASPIPPTGGVGTRRATS